MAPTYERTNDDGPHHSRELSREDVSEFKQLLAKAVEAKAMHIFTDKQVETLKVVIETFEDHGDEIREIIRREDVSRLWRETRLRMWGVIKWFLATFLLIVAVVQGWLSIIAPLLKWGSGK